MLANSAFRKSDLFISAGFILTAVFAQYSGLDLYLARFIYQSAGNQFLTDNHILTTLFHTGGRYLIGVLISVFLIGFVTTFIATTALRKYRLFSGYILLSILACIVLIAVMKSFTTLPCPWNTDSFGGQEAYVGIINVFATDLPKGHCYPSGHASGGFSLFGFYIWATRGTSAFKFYPKSVWLVPAAFVGTVFGVTQQLRGAHYLSHDLTTIGLCWLVCALIFWLFSLFDTSIT